jgi:hypothetical protein
MKFAHDVDLPALHAQAVHFLADHLPHVVGEGDGGGGEKTARQWAQFCEHPALMRPLLEMLANKLKHAHLPSLPARSPSSPGTASTSAAGEASGSGSAAEPPATEPQAETEGGGR